MNKPGGIGRIALMTFFLIALAISVAGCTRGFYRRGADREVYDILAEKDRCPWPIEQFHVYPDARARFADPNNPDHPPMPPDDEAAWKLSPHPQQPGHKGVGHVEGTAFIEMVKLWDAETRAMLEETQAKEGSDPAKHPVRTYFDEPINAPQKPFLLNLEQAVELGVVNSPQYQTFREQLYLSALPVTVQRFNFSYQWAAFADFVREWAGPDTPGGPQNTWTGQSGIGLRKLFSTGALLTANFVNTTVVKLGGGGTTTMSMISADFVQPLLQGGGKAVTLEPLTQAERNLFYSVRAFARFRRQYYLAVANGSNLPGSLSSAAGTTATAANQVSALAALGLASTDVSAGVDGYLPALFRQCDLAVDRKLVNDLQRALRILEGYQEGGMFSPLQVDQVRSNLLQAQNTVLNDQQLMMNSLDQFKLTLGLPANTPLYLDDAPARPITRQLDQYYEVIDDSDATFKTLEKLQAAPAEKLRGALRDLFTKDALVRNTEFQKKTPLAWDRWVALKDAELKARFDQLSAERRKLLDLKSELEAKDQPVPATDLARLSEVEFEVDLGGLEQVLRRYETKPWEKQAKKEQATVEQIKLFRFVASATQFVLVWARNERFNDVTRRWPDLPSAYLDDFDLLNGDVDMAQHLAVQAAHLNRIELMNARAQVVDAWRQLRVTANALMGVFNVGYNLQSQTPAGGLNPLAFSSAGTTQQVSLNFQFPLNRLLERNAYRAALINYQQARRNLMTLQDNIAVQVRFDVRQLQLFAANYQNQKKIIQSLYSQVENALEVIVAPSDPDQLKGGGTSGQANAAALTNQYLGALSQLNGAQGRMYTVWLSYLSTRMQLYLDLDRLPLDMRGVWTDELGRPQVAAGAQVSAPLAAPNPAVAPVANFAAPAEPSPEAVRPARFLPPPETVRDIRR